MVPQRWIRCWLTLWLVAVLVGCWAAPAASPTTPDVLPTETAMPTMPSVATPTVAVRGTPVPGGPTGIPEPPDGAYYNGVLGFTLLGMDALAAQGWQVTEPEMLDPRAYTVYIMPIPSATSSGGLNIGMLLDPQLTIEQAVAAQRAAYPDFDIQPTPITVDGNEGALIEGLPGMTGATIIYVSANDHLYELLFHTERLDDTSRQLLDQMRFTPPTQSVESLGLPPLH